MSVSILTDTHDTTSPLYGTIRFHGPKYHTSETRRFAIVFIDPRHLRPDVLQRCSRQRYLWLPSVIARKLCSFAQDCAEMCRVLIAWHKVLRLLSLACYKAKEISWNYKRKCKCIKHLLFSMCSSIAIVEGELGLALSRCRKC